MSVILLGLILLNGCVTVATSCPEPTQIDPETQRKASEEVASLPETSALSEVLAAGLDDRDKLRACNKNK